MVNIKLKYNFLKHHINLLLQSFRSLQSAIPAKIITDIIIYFIIIPLLHY